MQKNIFLSIFLLHGSLNANCFPDVQVKHGVICSKEPSLKQKIKEIVGVVPTTIKQQAYALQNVWFAPKIGTNYHEVVSGKLSRSAHPDALLLEHVTQSGIKHIINLWQPDPKRLDEERRNADRWGISLLHLPLSTKRFPTPDEVQQLLSWMYDAYAKNEMVHIHCRAGRDRTGLAVALWLLEVHKMTLEQAFHKAYGAPADFGYFYSLAPASQDFIRTWVALAGSEDPKTWQSSWQERLAIYKNWYDEVVGVSRHRPVSEQKTVARLDNAAPAPGDQY